jgi:PKD repeat protein
MAGSERGRVALPVVAGLLGLLCWLGGARVALAAGTFVVDGANPGCSDTAPGAGTEGNPPYCTISAAAAARGGPGTTILVKPAIYRDRVNVPASGAEGSPFTFQALGPGVVVNGADDFSDPALWTPVTGTVWQAVGVTWFPRQVFVDGAPLTRLGYTSVDPATVPQGTFGYTSGGSVYVNLGGDNPGTHETLVGRRDYGFALYGRSWVTIDGFTITRTNGYGIRASLSGDGRPPNHITITHNTVTFAGSSGINVSRGSTNVLIGSNVVSDSTADGITLTSVAATIQDNEVFRNLNNGIALYSPSISLQNRSWHNGRHGFAQFGGGLHVGDVAWGNGGRGFSVQTGDTTETRMFNCIGVNNGLTSGEYDLLVDSNAVPGFVSNSNIFWNRTTQAPIRFGNMIYATLAAYTAATGQDATSFQADPRFVNPEAGDFRLLPGSPAIDSADSSVAGWPAIDAAGQARVDHPATPDTGVGPVPYADRGALEYYPFSGPPVAGLTVTPAAGRVPLAVTADASGSGDPDGLPLSYRFDFGDGTVVGLQAEATTGHTYQQAGTFSVTVTVTDAEGETASASAPVTVAPPTQPPVAALTVTPASGILPLTVTADASASSDPGGTIVAYRFDFGDGTVVGPQAAPTASHTYRFMAGIFTVTVTVTDDLGATGSASATVTAIQELEGFASFEGGTDGWTGYGGATIQRVSGGIHGAVALEVRGPVTTTEFGINDSPNWVAKTLAAGTRYRFSAWVRAATSTGQARLRIREYLNGVQVGGTTRSAPVTLGSAWQRLAVDHVAEATGSTLDLQVLDAPVAPGEVFQTDSLLIRIVTGPGPSPPSGAILTPGGNITLTAGESYGFSGTSWDPDNYLPLTYLWNFEGGAPNSTAENPGAVAFSTPGTYTVTFTVTNSLGLADPTPDSRVITVLSGDNLVGNPSFETDTKGWGTYGGSTIQRVPGGQEGAFALEVRGPATTTDFGINDSPNWVATTGPAGTRYRFTAWIWAEVTFGQARLRVREYLNGVQVGGNTRSSHALSVGPSWQMLSVDHDTQATGSTLDFQVLVTPFASSQAFLVDNISIRIVP